MIDDKWKYGIIPGFLLHFSLGTIYSWSIMEKQLSAVFSIDCSNIFITFTLLVGVFSFLTGPLVEKGVRCSAKLCTLLYIMGILLCNLAVFLENFLIFKIGFLGFMASSIGIGYLIPIKNISLWIKDRPGLFIGVILMGFGLSRGITSMIYSGILSNFEYEKDIVISTAIILGIINFILVFIGMYFTRTPKESTEHIDKKLFSCWSDFKSCVNSLYRVIKLDKIWNYSAIIFFSTLPVSALLFSKGYYMMTNLGIEITQLSLLLGLLLNIFGRLSASYISDRVNDDRLICYLVYISALSCIVGYLFKNVNSINLMVDINTFCYGALFTIIPIALIIRYGTPFIARTSGIALFAWTLGSVIGNSFSNVITHLPGNTLNTILLFFIVLFIIGLGYSVGIWEKQKP